eukprot:2179187-Prymnesium_polylepis.1
MSLVHAASSRGKHRMRSSALSVRWYVSDCWYRSMSRPTSTKGGPRSTRCTLRQSTGLPASASAVSSASSTRHCSSGTRRSATPRGGGSATDCSGVALVAAAIAAPTTARRGVPQSMVGAARRGRGATAVDRSPQ